MQAEAVMLPDSTVGERRIYVACLASYNAGILHGRWIDMDRTLDEVRAEIRAMLAESKCPPAEEWAIHDYEGFGDYRLSEYEDLDELHALCELADDHGDVAFSLASHLGSTWTPGEVKEHLEDKYHGAWKSLEDYAENFYEDTGCLEKVPEQLRYYIDWEAVARDFELNGDLFTLETGGDVHVFSNC